MSALINSVEHALATAANDVVKVAKFVETSVLPVLKSAQANQSTIESVTSLVSPSAANIERAGFAVLGVVINAIDAAGAAAGAAASLRLFVRAGIRANRVLGSRASCKGHFLASAHFPPQ